MSRFIREVTMLQVNGGWCWLEGEGKIIKTARGAQRVIAADDRKRVAERTGWLGSRITWQPTDWDGHEELRNLGVQTVRS
jgi:hypothetical protein